MDWLRAVVGILVVVVLALLIGKTQNSKRTAVHVSVWVGSILVLLALRFGFTSTWEFSLLLLAVVLRSLEHVPSWLIYTVLAFAIGLVFRYILLLIAQSIADLAREVEKTNARITLMENSLTAKLDDIASRLPQRDEPEYLKELRKEIHRD